VSIHPSTCECDTLGCKLRRDGLFTLPGAATPTRGRRRPYRDPTKANHNSWEAGTAGEHRPGGFMPYLSSGGGRMHTKEYSENRVALDDIRRQQVSGPSIEKVS
jgi:hypothetical protein